MRANRITELGKSELYWAYRFHQLVEGDTPDETDWNVLRELNLVDDNGDWKYGEESDND